jgi:hypothetical protein
VPLACDNTITGAYGGGTGTALDPYAICSVAQWTYLTSDSGSWSKAFKLYADLDFSATTLATFASVGSAVTAFTGSLDGNGFKIKNLSVTGTTENLAIFKKTDSTVTIQNLTLQNISFTSNARMAGLILDHGNGGTLTLDHITVNGLTLAPTAGTGVGGLVGQSQSALVASNITLTNTSMTNNTTSGGKWGTIVGYMSAGAATISNVMGSSVTLSGASVQQAGGLLGYSMSTASFTDVTITGLNVHSSDYGGGIAGTMWGPVSFTRVHLTGSVFGVVSAGGMLAEEWGIGAAPTALAITESSMDGDISGSSSGGLVTTNFGGDVTISQSYYKGNQASVWNGLGGGLVGNAQGAAANLTISDSYAVSNLTIITANNVIAGLVGLPTSHVVINRSYYSGSLTSNTGTAPRACVAKTSSAASFTANDVYYDSTLCTDNASTTGAIAGATGLATAALQTATPFANWLPSVWVFTNGQNPKLAWE